MDFFIGKFGNYIYFATNLETRGNVISHNIVFCVNSLKEQ